MAIKLFGYEIGSKQKKATDEITDNPSFVEPEQDGSAIVAAGGLYGTYLDMDGAIRSEAELIKRYREVSLYPDVDSAIEDIVNEAIVKGPDGVIVKINLDDLEEDLSDSIRQTIQEEFDNLLKLLNFTLKGHDYFRRWYVDGRLYFHKLIDPQPVQNGIAELRLIDPRKIKKVREIKKNKDAKSGVDIVVKVEEYYVFNEKGLAGSNPGQPMTYTSGQGIKIAPEAIVFVPSGYVDYDKNMVLSYLHKAIKPANQLRMMEDSVVIGRIVRAPDRRVFYIDTGNLPKLKAEQYLQDMMNKFRNKIVYDSNTGEIRDDKKYMAMIEDFWLPRRGDGKGTQIDTLEGGTNLSQIDDVQYFKNNLYQALNVPLSRMKQDQPFSFGRGDEITRDEIKFSKFIDRLRNRFSELFNDLLKTQLVLKRVMNEEDWVEIKQKIRFDFVQDIYYSEITDLAVLQNRMEVVNAMQPFVGTYFSSDYIKERILRQTEEEQEEMAECMQKDLANKVNMVGQDMGGDPSAQGGMPPPQGGAGFDGSYPDPDQQQQQPQQ